MVITVPKHLQEHIRLMAQHHILGTTTKEVATRILERGFMDMIVSEYPKKHLEMMRYLKEMAEKGKNHDP